MKKDGVMQAGLIWMGAALSIAEVTTGTYFAPLGFTKGLVAIILGHLIGAVLMFFAGFIGAESHKNAMQSTSMSFGKSGSKFFAILNILQLVGWTAIMIYQGAGAADRLFSYGRSVWALVIGVLVIVWLILSKRDLGIINTIAVSALAILLMMIMFKLFNAFPHDTQFVKYSTQETMSFALALELSVAMPLSWLPLVSDYTCTNRRPFAVTLLSVISYSIVSVFMYIAGLSMALYTSQSNIANIIHNLGGWVSAIGLPVVILSTVTTTYLDAYSAGISALSVYEKSNPKSVSVISVVIATALAMLFNIENIEGFLLMIGSVFTPMAAVLIADYFILKSREEREGFCWRNLFVWLLGFEIYRTFLRIDSPISSTIPAMLISFAVTILLKYMDSNARYKTRTCMK